MPAKRKKSDAASAAASKRVKSDDATAAAASTDDKSSSSSAAASGWSIATAAPVAAAAGGAAAATSSSSAATATVSSTGFRWSFKTGGGWTSFVTADSDRIETAYQTYQDDTGVDANAIFTTPDMSFVAGKVPPVLYAFNFKTMNQTNLASSTARQLRRVKEGSAATAALIAPGAAAAAAGGGGANDSAGGAAAVSRADMGFAGLVRARSMDLVAGGGKKSVDPADEDDTKDGAAAAAAGGDDDKKSKSKKKAGAKRMYTHLKTGEKLAKPVPADGGDDGDDGDDGDKDKKDAKTPAVVPLPPPLSDDDIKAQVKLGPQSGRGVARDQLVADAIKAMIEAKEAAKKGAAAADADDKDDDDDDGGAATTGKKGRKAPKKKKSKKAATRAVATPSGFGTYNGYGGGGLMADGRYNFGAAVNADPHAKKCFVKMIDNEKRLCGEYAVFYHSYSLAALLYEVQASVAAVLFRFKSQFASLPRLLKAPFNEIPNAEALMTEFKAMPDQDHNSKYRAVAICGTTSIIAPDSEAPATDIFLAGYSCSDLSFMGVLENLLKSCHVPEKKVKALAKKIVSLSEEHGLDVSQFGGTPCSSGKAGHMLQIFMKRHIVDRYVYAAYPYGVIDQDRMPLSQHMNSAGPVFGQIRLLCHPSVMMQARYTRAFVYSADPTFHGKREAFQVALTALLNPILGTDEVRTEAATGIMGGQLPSWYNSGDQRAAATATVNKFK